MSVCALPPSVSLSSDVSFESRYGMWRGPPGALPSSAALSAAMILRRQNRLLLMLRPSFRRWSFDYWE